MAAIATIVGQPYNAVMKRAFGRGWRQVSDPGLYTTHMVKILRSYGYSVRKTDYFDFSSSAILFLDLKAHTPYWEGLWHCLVWDPDKRGRIIDPSWKRCRSQEYHAKAWVYGGCQTLIVRPKEAP